MLLSFFSFKILVYSCNPNSNKKDQQNLWIISRNVESDKEPELIPPLLLDTQLVTTSQAMWTKVLIDLGEDYNVLSFETSTNLL